jgi:hypothetical protein
LRSGKWSEGREDKVGAEKSISTQELILRNLLVVAKDVDKIKKVLFNGIVQKIDELCAWKETYPDSCNFIAWMKEHPQIEKFLRAGGPSKKKK